MRRRVFLQGGAGLAVSALAGARAWSATRHGIVVVGGGILGAAVAYELSRRGSQVTLLEKARPAAGATGRSFAWINAHFSKQPFHYHLLNRLGVQAWREIERQMDGDLALQWGGTIEWCGDAAPADELTRLTRQQQQWGYAARFITAQEFARLEPAARPGLVTAAAFSESEGAVDPVAATQALLRRAKSAGATVVYPCEVQGIEPRADREVLKTTQGEFTADMVVLAGGVATPRLASLLGARIPLRRSPGIVVHTAPQPRSIERVLVTRDAHLRQRRDGRLILGDDYGPPSSEAHKLLDAEPQDFPDPGFAEMHGNRIRAQAAKYLPCLERAGIEKVFLCWRPLPEDSYPVVGRLLQAPRVYAMVTHSGVTLGPLLGQLAALELLDGVKVDLLERYRPDRFAS